MKKCLKCERRIGFLPYLFGIRICGDCELEPLQDYKKSLEKDLKKQKMELFERKLYHYCSLQAEGYKPSKELYKELYDLSKELNLKGIVFVKPK